VMLLLDFTPSLSLSFHTGERTWTSYTEGCLSGGLSLCLFFFPLRPGSTSFRYQMVFANFYLEIITPYTLCDV
jgi:hypothetical protein